MQYQSFDLAKRSLGQVASGFKFANKLVNCEANPLKTTRVGRIQNAALETGIRILQHYPKQGWAYDDVTINSKTYPVIESVEAEKPFANLMRFRREGLGNNAPKVLFVAALSGHHATLSRETFAAFLPDHDIYVTDWLDARMVPVEEGSFGFEEYIEYVIEFMEQIGPQTHLVALCQAGVPALAAAAILSQNNSKHKPRSLTVMASPIDIRVNANFMTKVAGALNPSLLNLVAIHRTPKRYPGKGRLVYPGAFQLGGFMTLSIKSHIESHSQFFMDIYRGDVDSAEKHRYFYDEYFSILDGTAEFYIETLERVFIDQQLPKGMMTFRGQKVDCNAITDIPIYALEGAKDNMVRIGQCQAALDMCSNLPDDLKQSQVVEGVGHYGIFNGSTYQQTIAPSIKAFIQQYERP